MCMMLDTYRGTYRDEIGLVNNIPNILVYRVDAACDPHGEAVAGLEDGLEYKCSECGTFLPASTMRCPRCRTVFHLEEDTEGLPKKSPIKKHSTSTNGLKKVSYKKVKK